MLSSKSLRWAGSGVSNGRQRLSGPTVRTRAFSAYTSRTHTPRVKHPSQPVRLPQSQQIRSISLFGWGSSSQQPTGGAANTNLHDGADVRIGSGTLPESLSNIRTVKASHGTSDIPDPQAPHYLPHQSEPAFIEDLQEAITSPSGSEKFNELLEDSSALASEPERIGYMKEVCGLDFGWGPTAIMQWTLEHLHITCGLSWGVSIIVLASFLRLTMVKPMITAQNESAKLREMNPILKPLQQKRLEFLKQRNQAKASEVAQEMKFIRKEAGIKFGRAFIPMLIQFPMQFGAFRMLRNAGALPVPGFIDDGILWLSDLSLADPYFITPAVSSLFIYFQFKQSQQSAGAGAIAGSPVTPNMMKILGTALPCLSFVFMIWQPAAVQLYFMVSSVWAWSTSSTLRLETVRTWVGLPPNPVPETVTPTGAQKANAPATGGLRIAPRIVTPGVETTAQPTKSDRSLIDQGIEKIKSSFNSTTDKGSSMFSQNKEEALEKEREIRMAKYEDMRRREMAIERAQRDAKSRENTRQ